MGKVKGNQRKDSYYRFAKEQGYRARSAWKLLQLDSKFRFFGSSRSALDLCAAPGGWTQVCVERLPVGSLVVGVDRDWIRRIRGAVTLQEDITTAKCRSSVKRIMAEYGCSAFDLVLHDGSGNLGGSWAKEAAAQCALVIDAVKLATEVLAPNGHFVTEVFRSQDYLSVLHCLQKLFGKVEVHKPPASRSSPEIYVLGLNYKAPSKIDPRLLDIKCLFPKGNEAPKKIVDVLRGTKQKRHRDGYDDGVTTLRKLCSASEFIWCKAPHDKVLLGSVSSITFDDLDSLPIKDHEQTTEEIRALCDDVRVLGRQDFKILLKWRLTMRKALSPEKVTAALSTAENKVKVDEDEKLLKEMEDLVNAMEPKKKRAKNVAAHRAAKGIKHLVSESGTSESKEGLDSDLDPDEERKGYTEREEAFFDEEYERYLAKIGGSAKQRERSKQDYAQLEGDDDSDEDPVNESDAMQGQFKEICEKQAPLKRESTIPDEVDSSDRMKCKMTKKLYKKAMTTKKPHKKSVVASGEEGRARFGKRKGKRERRGRTRI